MKRPNIPCLWSPPDQESLRVAIARSLHLLQREHGLSLAELAHAAGCSAETMRLAYKRETTLGLEFFSNLRFWFRESAHCFLPYTQLIDPDSAGDAEPTEDERWERALRELEILRKRRAA